MTRSIGRIGALVGAIAIIALASHASAANKDRDSVSVRAVDSEPSVSVTMSAPIADTHVVLIQSDTHVVGVVATCNAAVLVADSSGSPFGVAEIPCALRFLAADSGGRSGARFRHRTLAWTTRHPLYAASRINRGNPYSAV